MSGRLRVVVATTDGPSIVQRITAEDPGLRSVVCLAGTSMDLPISAAYDAFVRRPTGVVERDVGHRVFRVDVDRPIAAGASWQLGLYLAHRLKAVGRLAEDSEPAEGIVWATGSVDVDLNVGPVDRVAEKARRSASVFGAEVPVLVICARGNASELPDRGDRLAVDRVEEALDALGLAGPPAVSAGGRWLPTAAFAVGAVSLALLGTGIWDRWSRPDGRAAEQSIDAAAARPPPPRPVPVGSTVPFDPASVVLEVLEGRPRDGGCGEEILPDPASDPAESAAQGVCAVAFRATNTGNRPVHMWLYAAVRGAIREYASRRRHAELATGVLVPGEHGSVRVQPPDWVRREVVVRGLLVLSGEARPQVSQALAGIDLMSEDDLDATVAGLRAIGVEVREIVHRVIPAR